MLNVDAPQVSDETEATQLMVHHLAIAAMYFECTRDDRGREAKELIKSRLNEGAAVAATKFVVSLVHHYDDIVK